MSNSGISRRRVGNGKLGVAINQRFAGRMSIVGVLGIERYRGGTCCLVKTAICGVDIDSETNANTLGVGSSSDTEGTGSISGGKALTGKYGDQFIRCSKNNIINIFGGVIGGDSSNTGRLGQSIAGSHLGWGD